MALAMLQALQHHAPGTASLAVAAVAAVATTAAALALFGARRPPAPAPLPVVVVSGEAAAGADTAVDRPVCVLVHGMWHGAWFWAPLQRLLSRAGYTSYAVELQPHPNRSGEAIAADLAATLDSLQLRNAVLLGHSQGGLITQFFLRDALAKRPEGEVAGAVLMGTFPLGMAIPAWGLVTAERNIYKGGLGVLGMLYYYAAGRLLTTECARRIFLLPATAETTVCGPQGSLQEYLRRLVAAPRDGWITLTHNMPPRRESFPAVHPGEDIELPMLVLGAAEDIIYPPPLMKPGFLQRFPGATHVVCERQAHCFADPGWEEAAGGALLRWLDELTSRLAASG